MEKLANTILVIFGITGDLAQRKLLPALFHLAEAGMLPDTFHVAGISRRGTTVADILALIKKRTGRDEHSDPEVFARLEKMLSVVDMNIGDPSGYGTLAGELDRLERSAGRPLHRLFYLAIPANLFGTVTARLAEADINVHEKGRRECRFLIEKPFGFDLASAKDLIAGLASRFDESQIYRIDHYLAKETAQNILAFRFENPLFSGTWNREHISHIMITAVESIGIEGRTAFYENMGAMRDLVQSHLLQLLALVTMNKPASMSSDDIHRQKEILLAHIRPPEAASMERDAVRGQYASYREETGNPESFTETYAAIRFSIDTEEWRGVPVFIRTGKAIREKITEITLVFSDPQNPGKKNYLTIRLPDDTHTAERGNRDRPAHQEAGFRERDRAGAARLLLHRQAERKPSRRVRAGSRRRDARRPHAVRDERGSTFVLARKRARSFGLVEKRFSAFILRKQFVGPRSRRPHDSGDGRRMAFGHAHGLFYPADHRARKINPTIWKSCKRETFYQKRFPSRTLPSKNQKRNLRLAFR